MEKEDTNNDQNNLPITKDQISKADQIDKKNKKEEGKEEKRTRSQIMITEKKK